MQYLVLSFSYKNTDLALRERLSFSDEVSKAFLEHLLESSFIKEAILLSTCNRVEIILITDDTFLSLQKCFLKLEKISSIRKDELEGRANTFEGYSAIHHIFLVASSLDSLVVGETQIGGQLKKAYRFSLHNHYCTHNGLGNVIDFAFKCASNVRNNTEISKKPISIASVAVSSLSSIEIENKNALVVGLGEMGKIVVKNLLKDGYSVKILNRSKDKALAFRDEISNPFLSVGDFSELESIINQYEIVFSATGAAGSVIKKEMIKNVPFKRHFFDLAIPRDIDDLADSSIRVVLVDDLQNTIKDNVNHREKDINIAYEIVGSEVNEFFKWLSVLSVEPIIKILRHIAKEASIKEVDKAIKKGYLPSDCEKNLHKTIHNIFNTFLHTPTKRIKEISSSAQISDIERVLKLIFDIDNEALRAFSREYDDNFKNGEKK